MKVLGPKYCRNAKDLNKYKKDIEEPINSMDPIEKLDYSIDDSPGPSKFPTIVIPTYTTLAGTHRTNCIITYTYMDYTEIDRMFIDALNRMNEKKRDMVMSIAENQLFREI